MTLKYREEKNISLNAKNEYRDGIVNLVNDLREHAKAKRSEYFSDVFTDSKKYRNDFRALLGWPLTEDNMSELPGVIEEFLYEEETHLIYRMSFEILDGLKMTGLFFKAKTNEKKPLVIVQHGGGGTPELISNFYDTTTNYNHMTERVLAHGVHAFAPQLLLWNQEEHDVTYSRGELDKDLKHLGSSITAVEIHGISRILDYFEAQDYVGNMGMIGLSYGGFYTLFMAACDTRIKSAVSSCYFNTRDKYPWGDWTWTGCANKFDDAEIACLVYPRRLAIQIADRDELFDHIFAEKSFEKIREYCTCAGVGMDWIDFRVFNGTHELWNDDAQIDQMIKDIS